MNKTQLVDALAARIGDRRTAAAAGRRPDRDHRGHRAGRRIGVAHRVRRVREPGPRGAGGAQPAHRRGGGRAGHHGARVPGRAGLPVERSVGQPAAGRRPAGPVRRRDDPPPQQAAAAADASARRRAVEAAATEPPKTTAGHGGPPPPSRHRRRSPRRRRRPRRPKSRPTSVARRSRQGKEHRSSPRRPREEPPITDRRERGSGQRAGAQPAPSARSASGGRPASTGARSAASRRRPEATERTLRAPGGTGADPGHRRLPADAEHHVVCASHRRLANICSNELRAGSAAWWVVAAERTLRDLRPAPSTAERTLAHPAGARGHRAHAPWHPAGAQPSPSACPRTRPAAAQTWVTAQAPGRLSEHGVWRHHRLSGTYARTRCAPGQPPGWG